MSALRGEPGDVEPVLAVFMANRWTQTDTFEEWATQVSEQIAAGPLRAAVADREEFIADLRARISHMEAERDDLTKAEVWPFSAEQAARLIASVSWPNERVENRDAWAVRMLTDRRDLLATEIPSARRRLESAIRAVRDHAPEETA